MQPGRGSDTTYITVTPKVLPLVVPLHSIGLGFVADLIEPALRVIIEETGYDRSIPYGQPTPFRLFPVFDPIKLAVDVLAVIPAGIEQALNNLGGGSMLAPTSTETTSTLAMSFASADLPATVDLTKDGTTDPVSGSTTSNGADTTLRKTGVETEGDASGTNATQSNATEIKQEDTTQQDEKEDTAGTTKDTADTDTPKDTAETTKDTAETTKDTAETTKDTAETTKDTANTKDTAETTKDTAETTKDTAETTKDTAETTKHTADTAKGHRRDEEECVRGPRLAHLLDERSDDQRPEDGHYRRAGRGHRYHDTGGYRLGNAA